MNKPQDNSEQRSQWNGASGETWSAFQDDLDKMMTPISATLLEAIAPKPGEQILDVGCGCGPTTIRMARSVAPGGHVTGIDISELLLKSARERSARLSLPVEFIEADAASHAFTERFDKVVSRFGVMFFADPVSAFSNLRTALKPGGQVIFMCWRAMKENVWMGSMMRDVREFMTLPPAPEGYQPGPFGFADAEFLNGVLDRAGFSKIDIQPFNTKLKAPGETRERMIAFASRLGPVAGLLREADDETRARIKEVIERTVDTRLAQGNPAQGAACWLVRASA